MLRKKSFNIKAFQNGMFRGYINNVNYDAGTFSLTTGLSGSKSYSNERDAQFAVECLTRIGQFYGYVFIYE